MNKYKVDYKALITGIHNPKVEFTAQSTDWREARQAGSLYESIKVIDQNGDEVQHGLHGFAEALLPSSPEIVDAESEADFDAWVKARNSIIRNVQREVLKAITPDIAKSPWVPTCGNTGKGCCCSPHFILRGSEFRGRAAYLHAEVVVHMPMVLEAQ